MGFDVLMGKAYVTDLKKPTEEELVEDEKKKQEELERSMLSFFSLTHNSQEPQQLSKKMK